MTKLAPTRWRYGPGYINETPRGTYSAYVCLGHGKRRRAVLKTLSEAKAWILSGSAGATPDQLLLEDALRARDLLPDSVSIEEAARYWRDHHHDADNPTPLRDAWAAYQAEVSRLIRPRTLCSYRQAANALMAAVGDGALLDRVTAPRIEALLARKTPHMRNNYIRALSAFLGWCASHGLVGENPVPKIRRARIPQGTPSILTPAECRRLLSIAVDTRPGAVAYFALGLFAGLRPEEALRVRPLNVLNGWLVLDGSITKTADARTVRVRPCLAAWLAKYPIPPSGFARKALQAVRARFGAWHPDIARHSFATYAYEECGDAVRVASELGHSGTAVFFRHYRALAAPGTGAEWFSIMPPEKKDAPPPDEPDGRACSNNE